MRKKSTRKQLSQFVPGELKSNQCDKSLHRNKSGCFDYNVNHKTKDYASLSQHKNNSSFLSKDFDDYYTNFLKSICEDSTDKNSLNIQRFSSRKHKYKKSDNNCSKLKKNVTHYKSTAIKNQNNKYFLNIEAVPETQINNLNNAVAKDNNIVVTKKDSKNFFKQKTSKNDNCLFPDNKITTDLKRTSSYVFTSVGRDQQLEILSHGNINNHNNYLSPKSHHVPSNNNSSKVLFVKHEDEFTLGDKSSNIKSNRLNSENNNNNDINNDNNNNDNNNNKNNNNTQNSKPFNLNVVEVSPVNNFNNAQKINISKTKGRASLIIPNLNSNFHNTLNSESDLLILDKSPQLVNKSNMQSLINKNESQYNQDNRNDIDNKRKDDEIIITSDVDTKDKTKYNTFQNKCNNSQPSLNLAHVEERITFKPRKILFCIPCK